ncbi:MAG: type I DNA topoisomerase, partial [Gemmatimonadales bacterium]|nr:type I DNA topoisomerase [Gemmatimonadales bacterium]
MSSTEAKDTKPKRKTTGRKKAAKKAAKKSSSKAKRKRSTRTKKVAEALVVVESPTKARTLGKYLGRGYAVKATVGHLRDLPTRELGVDVDAGFQPKYVTIKGKAKTLNEIKRAAKKASTVYLATDPDREGEAIAWHVADQLTTDAPVQRVLFHEITQDAVHQAMEDPGVIDDRKVNAQQARRILDRLVGYKASPLLWKAIKTGLSAGRVQTVALRLIVERERAIRAFKPQEYWSIDALCAKDSATFEASLHKIEGHKPQLHTEAEATAVVDAVRQMPFVVTDVQKKRRRKRPAAPFTTSTLQQEAAKKLGFSSRRTMRAAQDLYEGIEIGEEGPTGLITYMRTDSVRVSDVAVAAAREFIASQYGEKYLPESPNVYNSRKKAKVQDAHEAIRPSDVSRRPEHLKSYLTPDQLKLYQLIWQRFVASQMPPAQYDMTVVDFELGRYLFRATGSVLLFDGYHAVYMEGREAEEGKTMDDLPPLPTLSKGDQVEVKELTPNQHFTQPPPRFSEASLVKELERLGIGRPSTYSSIITTLAARNYVEIKQRRFFPTDLGETVEKVMVSRFPAIFNVEFTSEMELELDKVEEGDLDWQEVLENFYQPFIKALEAVDINQLVMETHGLGDLAKEKCPTCGSPLMLRTGRFGPFIACTKYPDDCRFTKPIKKDKVPDRPTDEKCHLCGSAMVIKTGRFGEFLACTTYPKCKGTRSIPLGIKCPKCLKGDLTERRTKRGKSFFGCIRYPDCDYSTWNRPTPEQCP